VSEIVATAVRLATRPVKLIDACSYQLVEDPTVEVELAIKPAEIASIVSAGLRLRARARLGASTGADSLALGETGWAYGASSASEAAVLTGGKVYHAIMGCAVCTGTPGQKGAMVRLVAAMID
jgi:hypothetical protein